MRIIFMGTPDFAVASLEALINSRKNIIAVITAPDRPSGRGQKLRESAVKQFASQKGLPVLQPTNLRDPDFIEELQTLKPDLQVVVAFRMLPKQVWQLPTHGTINLHASLLPEYRGAAPINWAVINGETKTGVTTFYINENIDTGDIIDQREVVIGEKETAGTLHDKLMTEGAALLVDTVRKIEAGTVDLQKQNPQVEIKNAPKIFKEDTRIDFNKDVKEVYNFIRGLSPYPAAHAILFNDQKEVGVKIFEAEYEFGKVEVAPGTLQTDNSQVLKVACLNGWLELTNLQIAGKKRMSVKETLNGLRLSEGSKFQ